MAFACCCLLYSSNFFFQIKILWKFSSCLWKLKVFLYWKYAEHFRKWTNKLENLLIIVFALFFIHLFIRSFASQYPKHLCIHYNRKHIKINILWNKKLLFSIEYSDTFLCNFLDFLLECLRVKVYVFPMENEGMEKLIFRQVGNQKLKLFAIDGPWG